MYSRLDLSRLPKATRVKSLNTRHTTPGFAIPGTIHRQNVLDRSHPSVQLSFHAFPQFTCPDFNIRALPKATLHRKDFVPPNPISLSHNRANNRGKGKIDISLIFDTSKKKTSKFAHVRRRLRSKIITAISLVVTRGADTVKSFQSPSTPKIEEAVKPPTQAHDSDFMLISKPIPKDYNLVLRDWTYLITPNLTVYRTPIPELVQNVRKAFTTIQDQASRLELSWSKPARHKSHLKRTKTTPLRPKSTSPSASDCPTLKRNGGSFLYKSPAAVSSPPLERSSRNGIDGGITAVQPQKPQARLSTQTPRAMPRSFSPSRPISPGLESRQMADRDLTTPLSSPGGRSDTSPAFAARSHVRMFAKPSLILPKQAIVEGKKGGKKG